MHLFIDNSSCVIALLSFSQNPNPKTMQINLTGFLNAKNAMRFMSELWDLLTSAQDNIAGIPAAFLEQKKEEIKKRQVVNNNNYSIYEALNLYVSKRYNQIDKTDGFKKLFKSVQ